MENDIKLVLISNDEKSQQLRYKFVTSTTGEKWKELYKNQCELYNNEPLEQGELDDYEYYKKTHPYTRNNENYIQYFLVVNEEPVTMVVLKKDITDLIEITLTTSKRYLRQGYATKSVELIEELMFSKENIRGLKLIDFFSRGNATSKIARKFGFNEIRNGEFIKLNPRYKENIKRNEGEAK